MNSEYRYNANGHLYNDNSQNGHVLMRNSVFRPYFICQKNVSIVMLLYPLRSRTKWNLPVQEHPVTGNGLEIGKLIVGICGRF